MEGEFGIYRQLAGECYYISIEQIKNSLALQRSKLFSKLDIEELVSYSKEECCTANLTEGEIFRLDKAFTLRSTLSDTGKSSLFYISAYVAFKGGLALKDAVDDSNFFKNSEFLLLLLREKLLYPPVELFELCCILFCYYKNVKKTCMNQLLIGFNEICES